LLRRRHRLTLLNRCKMTEATRIWSPLAFVWLDHLSLLVKNRAGTTLTSIKTKLTRNPA